MTEIDYDKLVNALKEVGGQNAKKKDKDDKSKLKRLELLEEIESATSYYNRIKVTKGDRQIYRYDKELGYYVNDGEEWIRQRLNSQHNGISKYWKNEIIDIIRDTYSYKINRDEFDDDIYLINLKNGIYDIREKALIRHTPDKLFLSQLPITYNKNAKIDKIKDFLDSIFRTNPEYIDTVQELFGYCLLKDYPIQKAFILEGSGGNGKSTLLNLLQAMLGDENVCNVNIDDIASGHRYVAHNLYGKLANISIEVGNKILKETRVFKMATGGDVLMGEKKHIDVFEFRNFAKLIFAVNEIPRAYDESNAFYRRWLPIEFREKFEGENEVTGLINQLTTEEEISGLFNWSLEGLYRLLENGNFTGTTKETEVRQWWHSHTSNVYGFIKNCYEPDEKSKIPKEDVFDDYSKYCHAINEYPKSYNQFCKEFYRVCPYPMKNYRDVKDGERYFTGIRNKMRRIL